MGQKVNPIGFRVTVNHDWDSVWYDDNNYRDFLLRDWKIQKFVKKNYANFAISRVITERTGNHLTVLIQTAKPGAIIGKKVGDVVDVSANGSSYQVKILKIA
jgi:small subunit ribosomal protein S3